MRLHGLYRIWAGVGCQHAGRTANVQLGPNRSAFSRGKMRASDTTGLWLEAGFTSESNMGAHERTAVLHMSLGALPR